MLKNWIEKTEEMPDGIMFIDESLRHTMKKVQSLSHEDLLELEAFLDYLLEETGSSKGKSTSAKLCDFMAAGMQKVG